MWQPSVCLGRSAQSCGCRSNILSGKLKDFQFEIHVDSKVQPVAQPARRIPFHIQQQVEQEINNLEKQGIIEAVEGPTPWVSPVDSLWEIFGRFF